MTKGEWMRVCTETGDPFPPFISNIYDMDVIRSRFHLCLKAQFRILTCWEVCGQFGWCTLPSLLVSS